MNLSSTDLSRATESVLEKWCEVPPEIEIPRQTVSPHKRKRVKIDSQDFPMSQRTVESTSSMSSQEIDSIVPISLSQPERGRHGTMTVRKKARKSGF